MTETRMLKPGLLVSLSSTVAGGCTYDRVELPAPNPSEKGEDIARWETTRTIDDAAERERAGQARSQATSLIRRECVKTRHGLLCTNDNENALDLAVQEGRRIAREFNATAVHSTVGIFVIKGRIASTDEEAARALADEMRTLLEQMETGVKGLDVKAIRDAATRAREVGQMLDESKTGQVSDAIKAARTAARQIVKRVQKGGEDGARVLQSLSVRPIASARFAFLDADEKPAANGDAAPMSPIAPGRIGGLDGNGNDDGGGEKSTAPAEA